ELEGLDDARFAEIAGRATVFARVSPEQKARLVRTLRAHGRSVGFLGDGVNDAPALAASDVGIAMGCGADLTRDAAAVCLMGND
ncbi:HAD-IC family P-type ATPase, partial [Salmonella enterica]|uniref:HAD-IC family P-type ATPase n=1 Tax=Salmonella enterica TaxID=28901 RepID=UPI003CF16DBF